MHEEDNECDEEIDARHDRHEQCRERCDTMDAAEDDHSREYGEHTAHDVGINAECLLHRDRNRIRLHGDIDQTERDRDKHGKEFGDCRLPKGVLNVVRRSAVKEAVSTRNLVDLGERALDKARRCPNEGDDPHPEHSTGTTRHNGDRNARDIADTDARGGTDTERLKRGDRLASAWAATELPREQPHHLGQRTQLNKSGRDCEPQTAAHKHNDDDISPQKIIDRADHRVEKIHRNHPFQKNKQHHNGKNEDLSNCIPVFFHKENHSGTFISCFLYFSLKRV